MKINHLATATIFSGLLFLSACSSWFGDSKPAPKPQPTPVASETRDSSHSSSDIRDAQMQLAKQGFYHGAIDGVWGPATDTAVRNFQTRNHLFSTGKLDDETLLMLHDTSNAPDMN